VEIPSRGTVLLDLRSNHLGFLSELASLGWGAQAFSTLVISAAIIASARLARDDISQPSPRLFRANYRQAGGYGEQSFNS
jgi:hypothetical protein